MTEERPFDDDVQRVIDPETGRDITGEYVRGKLEELDKIAEEIILDAVREYRNTPASKHKIYEQACEKIENRLGVGSIGPATAAAAPLMEEKLRALAEALEIDQINTYN
jgi:hypothetical protein